MFDNQMPTVFVFLCNLQSQAPPPANGGKTEAEIKEEEDLQLALALSQSEAEEKEKMKLKATSMILSSAAKTVSNSKKAEANEKVRNNELILQLKIKRNVLA